LVLGVSVYDSDGVDDVESCLTTFLFVGIHDVSSVNPLSCLSTSVPSQPTNDNDIIIIYDLFTNEIKQ